MSLRYRFGDLHAIHGSGDDAAGKARAFAGGV
jgi:hypothetical protein